MEKYSVTGMSCAACQTRVEKAVSKVPGVKECAVSLLTNSMGVEGTASPSEIIAAVEKAGYGASLAADSRSSNGNTKKDYDDSTGIPRSERPEAENGVNCGMEDSLKDRETPLLLRRLCLSAGFLIILMYISMGHMMWNWPLPAFLEGNHVAMGLSQMIIAAVVMLINRKFFISGTKSFIHGAPNMDTLVALGSGISFIYSTAVLFEMTDAVLKNDDVLVMNCMDNLYFEGAAMIVTLITIGKMLEAMSKGKTTDALKSLMKLAPKTAVLLRDGAEVQVDVSQLNPGDVFVVRPGESIPVDGIVLEGSSAVNEAALTGESVPVEKTAGSQVSAATMNTSGFLECKATRTGEDTTLSQIIRMVSDAAATKAPIAKTADRVSGVFVPAVITIAVVTMIIWLLAGAEFTFALSRAITVLVVSCPCALGLATPVAIMVGNGIGARNGILFKTSAALESAGRTEIIAMDKTGTITKGQMEVVSVSSEDEISLFEYASGLESKSEHPLAKAIINHAAELNIEPAVLTDFEATGGRGVSARTYTGKLVFGGNADFIKEKCPSVFVEKETYIAETMDHMAEMGHTPLLFAIRTEESEEKLLGIVAVADVIKDDCADAVSQLKKLGIRVVMLTGDNEKTARTIASQAGIDEVVAEVLPDGKEKVIRELMKQGKTAMAGDGINDAPALTRADIGIAVGAGTDVAIDAADIVLVKSRLQDIPAAIRLSRRTLLNIKENLFWAFFYNAVLIPVAAGAYYRLWGIQMNPMLGAAAMSLSSVSVVSNALRLNFIDIFNSKHDKKIKHSKEDKMEKIIKVEGMMCHHCEAHVKEALEKMDGVLEAVPDHSKNEVKVSLSKDVASAEFEKVIATAGYKFIG